MLLAASRARAAANGRSYCAPDDVKAMASNVLSHRIIPSTTSSEDGLGPDDATREIVQDILRSVPVTEAV
jgi:MoxR-like ATPase